MAAQHLVMDIMLQLLYIIFNKSDASIKIKTLDVTTNNNGIYSRANDIIVLNVVSIHKSVVGFILTSYIAYRMNVSDDKNTLSIECYTGIYYVDLDDLFNYINDKSSTDHVRAYGYAASKYNIRIYYI